MKTARALFITMATMAFSAAAMAQEAAHGGGGITNQGLASLGAYIGLGLAAFGGALGQSKAAASALEGIARNPGATDKIFTPFILSLAFIESLVIYALVVAFIKT